MKSAFASLFVALFVFLFFLFSCLSSPLPKEIRTSPRATGLLVAENLLARKYESGDNGLRYQEVCTAYGAVKFAGITENKPLLDRLVKRYEIFLDPVEARKLMPKREHVDDYVFGALPLEIYLQTGDQRFLDLGIGFADRQWNNPLPNGLTSQTRYWIDDMYMVGILQIQAYRATGKTIYADRIVQFLSQYLDKLQQPNGLFRHGEISPFYWGRGNGWVAASLTEVLLSIPESNPGRKNLMEGYKKMMDCLVSFQAENGTWRQIIDKTSFWYESSCTAMFTFALHTGISKGWLAGEKYQNAAKRGYEGILDFLDDKGNIRDVCQGTGQSKTAQYYYDRKRVNGDLHGQAPVLWTINSLLSKDR
ncbi:MAG: glycoside hydrolase family 88 protein [Spirochaetales bacterium]|nr:glycoside hydrolase family 88 protein [Spirochaetales bacterium]